MALGRAIIALPMLQHIHLSSIQATFFPFHLQAYVTHELMEGNAKTGVWGELFGGPCATCFATEQGKALSTALPSAWLVWYPR